MRHYVPAIYRVPTRYGQFHPWHAAASICTERPVGRRKQRSPRWHRPWLIVTEVTPQPGKVTLMARPELDTAKGTGQRLPKNLPDLNVCCSLKRSRGAFDSFPDPFPEIVGRTFIFTDKGRTFLDKTVRRKLPKAATDDPRTNPPWGSELMINVGELNRSPVSLVTHRQLQSGHLRVQRAI